MRYNLPNLLTLLRIALIPVLVVFFYLDVAWSNLACALVFALAGLTDWLDGYLARRLGETTAFGAFLDPVADKLMVATALLLIVDRNPTLYEGVWISVPAAIIVGREITISALREWMAEVGASSRVAVNMVGKVKTSAQMLALFLLLYRDPIFTMPTLDIGMVCFYIAAVLTLWSMIIYLRAAWPMLFPRKDAAD